MKWEGGMSMTNSAALGYMIMAAKVLKLPKELIQQLEQEMQVMFDLELEEDAEQVYKSFV